MPFKIVRNDITLMTVDAIVNSTSKDGKYLGGAELSILEEAGPRLHQARLEIGTIEIGQAMLTKGYDLKAKYIIHTLGPMFEEDTKNYDLLRTTYRNVLSVAKGAHCKSLAFPLISTGLFGYPKRLALTVAEEVITDFLYDHEMDIYLVIYDEESYLSSMELYDEVSRYLDETMIYEKDVSLINASIMMNQMVESADLNESLDNKLSHIDEGFSKTLLALIADSHERNATIYNRANVDKRLFSKIKNNSDYRPSKNIAIAFAIALKLNLEETEDFIERAGYALSKSIVFDVIIEYCIINQIYDIYTVNEILYDKDQNLLGSTML